MSRLGSTLMLLGAVLVVLGLVLHFGPSLPWLGRLPGDLRIERSGVRIYIPITSCLLVSLVVSGVLWLLGRLR
jgi:Protein of unknown function (DUF2905)